MRISLTALSLLVAVSLLAACGGGGRGGGGGGSTSTGGSAAPAPSPSPSTPVVEQPAPPVPANAANVMTVTVDGGANGNYPNGLFASATVCQPGTSNCRTIDRLLVDTGSFGLRVMSSALGDQVLGTLPAQRGAVTDNGLSPLGQCAQFISGYTWGSVRQADVQLAGERIASLPIQVIGDTSSVGPVPVSCQNAGGTSLSSVDDLGANGILGVGLFTNDCPACTSQAITAVYYTCPAGGSCAPAQVPAAQQVVNPVARLRVNNNGVVLTLPAVPDLGLAKATGTLTFGIGTQSNNALATNRILQTDAFGFIQTRVDGTLYRSSFIDSGSNALFFPSATLPVCGGVWYCPADTVTMNATLMDAAGGNAQSLNFDIANVTRLLASGNKAFDNLGGNATADFDWGLPFFYGRTVYTAIQGRQAGSAVGPYVAY